MDHGHWRTAETMAAAEQMTLDGTAEAVGGGVPAWAERAEYMREIHVLIRAANRELDAAQVGACPSEEFIGALGDAEAAWRRYTEACREASLP